MTTTDDARRVLDTLWRHNSPRRMTPSPHPRRWGCGLECFPPHLHDALHQAVTDGHVIRLPDDRYAAR